MINAENINNRIIQRKLKPLAAADPQFHVYSSSLFLNCFFTQPDIMNTFTYEQI